MDPLVAGFRPRVLDLVDVDSAKFLDYTAVRAARPPARWVFGIEGRRLRSLESRAVAEADATVLCTAREGELLESFARPRRLEIIGNGVDLDAFPFAGREGRRSAEILFVGAMDYQANVDAVVHLARDLLPRIRARQGAAELTIVGRKPAAEVLALGKDPAVNVVPDVPSVVPYLHRARVSLLPFRVARGIQNKALESLAAGLPVVMSAATAGGLDGVAGRDYLVGESPEELADRTLEVLADAELHDRLARAGRDLVEQRYAWSAVLDRFLGLVEEVGTGGRRR
jgi:glycosyltransferase involved in cell wall biosynthesis